MTPLLRRQVPLVALFAAFSATVLACNAASDEDYVAFGPSEPIDQSGLDATPISVQYILENPSAYASKRFTLDARIVDVWSVRAFTVIGQQFPANETLLVVARDDVAALKDVTGPAGVQGAIVRVTGTVRTDGIEAVEREFGIELSKAVHSLAPAKNPVFVAERVVVVEVDPSMPLRWPIARSSRRDARWHDNACDCCFRSRVRRKRPFPRSP